jgi:hypothetical protein
VVTPNSGQWTLGVKVPGRPRREFNDLRFHGPGFRKLKWVGFSSNTRVSTSFYLDNFPFEAK